MLIERRTVSVADEEADAALNTRINEILAAAATTAPTAESARIRQVEKRPMGWQRPAIGWGMMGFGALLFTQLLALWPAVIAATGTGDTTPGTTLLFGLEHITFHPEVALLLMVALVGSLASLVELIRGFVKYAGRDELSTRWAWWYLLRPVQGATLAVVVYFALRGGLLEGVNGSAEAALNPFGLAAFAGLVGLFTRHAVAKLSKVFDALFDPPQEDADVKVIPATDGATGTATVQT